MYGGANETRYAYDIEDMVEEVNGRPNAMHTINSAVFSSTRLLTLQTRLSAAYKDADSSSHQPLDWRKCAE